MSANMDTSTLIADDHRPKRSRLRTESDSSSDGQVIECKKSPKTNVFLTPHARKHRTKYGAKASRSYPVTHFEKRPTPHNVCVEASCLQIGGRFIQSKLKLCYLPNCLKIALMRLDPQWKVSIPYSDLEKLRYTLNRLFALC